jgi:hypothetical protein
VGSERGSQLPKRGQSEEDAMKIFYGMDDETKAKGELLGDPIPGYSGVNRRI